MHTNEPVSNHEVHPIPICMEGAKITVMDSSRALVRDKFHCYARVQNISRRTVLFVCAFLYEDDCNQA